MAESSPRVIAEVVRQHAEEAAFGWALRERALDSPAWPLRELMRLDARSAAHFDALTLAGEQAWPIMREAWEDGLPGECFAALVSAARLGNWTLIDDAIGLIADSDTERAAAGALGWVPENVASAMIEWWLASNDPLRRRLALGGLLELRGEPGPACASWLASDDEATRIAALELLGALGRVEPAGPHWLALDDEHPGVRLAGLRGAWRLGDPGIAERLLEHVLAEDLDRRQADLGCALAFVALPKAAAESWLAKLVGRPDPRLAMIAASAIGDPTLVPWLIELAAAPATARLAVQAIVAITGVDLELERLDGTTPSGPTEGADLPADVPEDDLPWPDAAALAQWWPKVAADHVAGPGALWGRRGRSGLRSVLADPKAPQWLRTIAAWRLALASPGVRFPSEAPAPRQRTWLEIR
jgi:uncharacterized protein (TIGR02270 family)